MVRHVYNKEKRCQTLQQLRSHQHHNTAIPPCILPTKASYATPLCRCLLWWCWSPSRVIYCDNSCSTWWPCMCTRSWHRSPGAGMHQQHTVSTRQLRGQLGGRWQLHGRLRWSTPWRFIARTLCDQYKPGLQWHRLPICAQRHTNGDCMYQHKGMPKRKLHRCAVARAQMCVWGGAWGAHRACSTCVMSSCTPAEHSNTAHWERCPHMHHLVAGTWLVVSACNATCGGGSGERGEVFNVTQPAEDNGLPCPYANGTLQNAACTNSTPCPVDCVSSWRLAGVCSGVCGGGAGSTAEVLVVTVESAHGGMLCPAANGTVRATACVNSAPCPVDCVGSFVAGTECPAPCGGGTGMLVETFVVSTPAQHGGAPCMFGEGHTRPGAACTNSTPCAVDCESGWMLAGICNGTCGGGVGKVPEELVVTVEGAHGGLLCPASNGTRRAATCTNTTPCPVDCWCEACLYSSAHTTLLLYLNAYSNLAVVPLPSGAFAPTCLGLAIRYMDAVWALYSTVWWRGRTAARGVCNCAECITRRHRVQQLCRCSPTQSSMY